MIINLFIMYYLLKQNCAMLFYKLSAYGRVKDDVASRDKPVYAVT